jgi:hypothetical protein
MTQHTEVDDTEARGKLSKSREVPADTLSAVGSTIAGRKNSGLLPKIALARTAFALARRYPIAALCIGGVAIAVLLASSRRAPARTYLR